MFTKHLSRTAEPPPHRKHRTIKMLLLGLMSTAAGVIVAVYGDSTFVTAAGIALAVFPILLTLRTAAPSRTGAPAPEPHLIQEQPTALSAPYPGADEPTRRPDLLAPTDARLLPPASPGMSSLPTCPLVSLSLPRQRTCSPCQSPPASGGIHLGTFTSPEATVFMTLQPRLTVHAVVDPVVQVEARRPVPDSEGV